MEQGDYNGALGLFTDMDYADSNERAAQCHYQLGCKELNSGNVDEAVYEYAYAVELPKVQEALLSIRILTIYLIILMGYLWWD